MRCEKNKTLQFRAIFPRYVRQCASLPMHNVCIQIIVLTSALAKKRRIICICNCMLWADASSSVYYSVLQRYDGKRRELFWEIKERNVRLIIGSTKILQRLVMCQARHRNRNILSLAVLAILKGLRYFGVISCYFKPGSGFHDTPCHLNASCGY